MRRRSFWAGIALALATCLVFGHVCVFEFTNWDDNLNISQNPLLNPPSLENVRQFWVKPFQHLYIPVTYTLWSGVAAVAHVEDVDNSGIHLNPYPFHTLNLILHILCVLAVWRLIRRLVDSEWATAVGAALFALHPVQVEAVAWITGTKDLLGTLLSVLAIIAFLDFAKTDDKPRRWGYLGWGTLLFIAAILSKPTAVVTPILVLLLAWWNPPRWGRRQWGAWSSWMLIAAGGAWVTHLAQPITSTAAHAGPGWFRVFIASDALAFYAWKLLWPIHLIFDYGRTPARLMASGQWHWTWIVPVGVVVVMALMRVGRRGWICLGLFVVCLLPVLGLTAFRFQQYFATTADRYLYPAMLGLGLAAAWMMSRVDVRSSAGKAVIGAVAIILCLASVLSFRQGGFWRDSLTLCDHELEINPLSAAGHNNRGLLRFRDLHYETAVEDFRAAAQIEPQTLSYHTNLAKTLFLLGRAHEGIEEWDHALRQEETVEQQERESPAAIGSTLANAYYNLADWTAKAGESKRAMEFLQRAARFDPENDRIKEAMK